MTTVSNVSTNDLYLNVGQNDGANAFINSIHNVAGAHESNVEVQKPQKKKELNIDELLNDNKILSQISGLPEDKAAEAKAKIKECLTYALEDLKSRQATIDEKTLIKNAEIYYKATEHGYKSAKDFYNQNKRNHDSVQIRLIKFNYAATGKYDGTIAVNKLPKEVRGYFTEKYDKTVNVYKLSKEELDKIIDFNDKDSEKLNSYLESYFNEFLKGKELNTQKRDFYKLIYNTPDVDKEVLFKAIEYLESSNRCPGFEALIESYTSEKPRTDAVDKCGVDFLKEMIEKDVHGNRISEKDMTKIVRVLALYKSEKGAQEFHDEFAPMMQEFFSAHEADFKRIEEKQEKQEKLTPEEEELLALKDLFYKPTAQGTMDGCLVNENLSKEFKTEILQNYADDINGLIIEDDVYNGIKSFIDELAENDPNFSERDIQSLRDLLEQVSGGKYSEITGDICNSCTNSNSSSDITSCTSNNSESASDSDFISELNHGFTSETNNFGFAQTTTTKPQITVVLEEDNSQPTYTVTKKDAVSNTTDSEPQSLAECKDFKTAKEFCKKNNISFATLIKMMLFSHNRKNRKEAVDALDSREKENKTANLNICVNELIDSLKDSQIVALSKKSHLVNQDATREIKRRAQKLQEEKKIEETLTTQG